MSDTSKIAKNLKAFQIAINAHDRENPTHNAYGIGLAHFDLDRLGFDEGEEILPGITIHADSGVTGNFVASAEGAAVDADTVVAELRGLPDTASSSLRADVTSGAPDHELDAIGGAVLRAARRHDLLAPHTAELVARVQRRAAAG